MHKIENMPSQTSSIFSRPWQMSRSACFSSKILCVVICWKETACVLKARVWPRVWPRVWQIPGPRAAKNLLMPHPWDWQGGQMPRSSPGGGGLGAAGIDWCIKGSTNDYNILYFKLVSGLSSTRYTRVQVWVFCGYFFACFWINYKAMKYWHILCLFTFFSEKMNLIPNQTISAATLFEVFWWWLTKRRCR